jgi:DNA replication protein DnaC
VFPETNAAAADRARAHGVAAFAEIQDAVAHGRTLLLLGDPGTGKTRLLTTVTDQARERWNRTPAGRVSVLYAHPGFLERT